MSTTEQVRSALAAYDPGRPRWQQQRQYGELQRALNALTAKVREWEGPGGKLDRMWTWLDANPNHPEHDAREEVWLALNDRYETAYRLLGEAWEALKREEVTA